MFSPSRSLRLLAIYIVAAALLLGCRAEVHIAVTVDSAERATTVVTFRFDESLMDALDALEVDPTEELRAALAEDPESPTWRLEEDPAPPSAELRLILSEVTLDETSDALRQLSAGLSPGDPAILLDLDLESPTAGAARLTGDAGLRAPSTAGALRDGEPIGPSAEELESLFAEAIDASLVVELPGETVDTDADAHQDGTYVWELPVGEVREVRAQTQPVQRPAWVYGVAVALAILLVVLIGSVARGVGGRRRRRRRSGRISFVG